MEKIHFEVQINAPKEKVYEVMLGSETYPEWTSAFNEGSNYKGDWSEGSKIIFTGPDPKTGKEGGMIGLIRANRLNEFVSIGYMGVVTDGVEDTTSDFVKSWTEAYENYTFSDEDGRSKLDVDLNVPEEFVKDFTVMWPKALANLKEIAERV